MPVAHGYESFGFDVGSERGFEGAALFGGQAADGRAAADFGVVMSYGFGAARGD